MSWTVCGLVLIGLLWTCNAQSRSLFDGSRHHDGAIGVVGQCRKTCVVQKISLWDLNGLKSLCSCFMKCVLRGLRAKVGNGSTITSSPPTSSAEKRWYRSTTPSTVKPTTTADSNNGCPPNSPPGPGEIVPGRVRDVAVTFAHQQNGTNKRWVAEVTWSPPQGSNVTSNWRGYLPMWVPVGDDTDNSPIKAVRCQLLPKNQTKFIIDETNGWKHPHTLYLAVVALPTNEETFPMNDFSPPVPDLDYRVTPTKVHAGGDHSSFSLMSPEGLAILSVALIVVGFVCLWILKVAFFKQKKADKQMDDSKERLVV